jgi:hypothetical protein
MALGTRYPDGRRSGQGGARTLKALHLEILVDRSFYVGPAFAEVFAVAIEMPRADNALLFLVLLRSGLRRKRIRRWQVNQDRCFAMKLSPYCRMISATPKGGRLVVFAISASACSVRGLRPGWPPEGWRLPSDVSGKDADKQWCAPAWRALSGFATGVPRDLVANRDVRAPVLYGTLASSSASTLARSLAVWD